MLELLSLSKRFVIQISIIRDKICQKIVSKLGMDFIQILIIHDDTCEVLHKKCHQKISPQRHKRPLYTLPLSDVMNIDIK